MDGFRIVAQPDGTSVQLGGVSQHANLIEHPRLAADRIVRLARLVGRDNVVAGTDCAFSPGPFQRRFHPSIMWAKLETSVAGAKLATKELWGSVYPRAEFVGRIRLQGGLRREAQHGTHTHYTRW